MRNKLHFPPVLAALVVGLGLGLTLPVVANTANDITVHAAIKRLETLPVVPRVPNGDYAVGDRSESKLRYKDLKLEVYTDEFDQVFWCRKNDKGNWIDGGTGEEI